MCHPPRAIFRVSRVVFLVGAGPCFVRVGSIRGRCGVDLGSIGVSIGVSIGMD